MSITTNIKIQPYIHLTKPRKNKLLKTSKKTDGFADPWQKGLKAFTDKEKQKNVQ